jgi:nucleoside-diphosphate-sugar epimerase
MAHDRFTEIRQDTFLRDVLTGSDIRFSGDENARRSYLYGSDAAWWTLVASAKGTDGAVYNLCSTIGVTRFELIRLISDSVSPRPRVAINTVPTKSRTQDVYTQISL